MTQVELEHTVKKLTEFLYDPLYSPQGMQINNMVIIYSSLLVPFELTPKIRDTIFGLTGFVPTSIHTSGIYTEVTWSFRSIEERKNYLNK